MNDELAIFLGVCLIFWGVSSANPMFPVVNRPPIFREKWGEIAFAITTMIIFLSAIILAIWSFSQIKWYVNILIILGSMTFFSFAYGALPSILRQSAAAPVLAATGLLVIQYMIWF